MITPSTSGNEIVFLERPVVHAPVPAGYTPIEEILARSEADPRRAAALQRARQRLGERLEQADPVTLASLRLRRGLSQEALARAIGNSQPSYSKIEAGKTDVQFSTFEKLVNALGVSRDELASALNATQRGRP